MNTSVATDAPALARAADRLRSLHRRGEPLVLVNVWDAASARRVEAAGARALATSSAAIAAALGVPDDDTMGPELAFGAVRRIAAGASVPVTADVEAGYGLSAADLVEELLGAGAVGCNLEDSDHSRPGRLIDADAAAGRLADVRREARRAGVDIVLNARIDTFFHGGASDPEALVDETVRRARLYLAAGADVVFPVRVADPATAAQLVAALDAHVNVGLGPSTTVAEMAAAGVSRISLGPGPHARAMAELDRQAEQLLR